MPVVVVDTDVVSFRFKKDTRARLYRRHLIGQDPLIAFMTLAERPAKANWRVTCDNMKCTTPIMLSAASGPKYGPDRAVKGNGSKWPMAGLPPLLLPWMFLCSPIIPQTSPGWTG
jgi:hypothetical protein